jgi:hypothetical protein
LVATERDLQTQAAVADLVSGVKSDAIAQEDWFYFQSILSSQSRALMAKGNIIVQRQFHVEALRHRTKKFPHGLSGVSWQ